MPSITRAQLGRVASRALPHVVGALVGYADTFVDKGEFGIILGAVKDRRDDAQRVAEERFERIETDVDRLQAAVVPRGPDAAPRFQISPPEEGVGPFAFESKDKGLASTMGAMKDGTIYLKVSIYKMR